MTVEEIFVERGKLREAVNAELIEFTGQARDFIWTDKIIEKDGRTWHELKIIDVQMLCYASFDANGFVRVVNEIEEIFA